MHAAMYKQLLKEVGIRVISVTEPIEEGTPSAVILEGMNEVVAERNGTVLTYRSTLLMQGADGRKKDCGTGLCRSAMSPPKRAL